jgi:hypothetical protein
MARNILFLSLMIALVAVPSAVSAGDFENDCLREAKLDMNKTTFPTIGAKAAGVIKRNAGDDGTRYLAQEVSGNFRAGDSISVYSIHGDLVGIGKVYSVYGSDFYIDMWNAPPYSATIGNGVFKNYTRDDARAEVHSKRDVFLNVGTMAKVEEEKIDRQIAAEQMRESADRLKWQEEMTRQRRQLDAQYNAYYYGYRYYPYY